MNEHQRNIWQDMITTLDKYLAGVIDYPTAVKNLEGLLDAGEFADQKLVKSWYNYWQPLEILDAVKGSMVEIGEAEKNVLKMRQFLIQKQEK